VTRELHSQHQKWKTDLKIQKPKDKCWNYVDFNIRTITIETKDETR